MQDIPLYPDDTRVFAQNPYARSSNIEQKKEQAPESLYRTNSGAWLLFSDYWLTS